LTAAFDWPPIPRRQALVAHTPGHRTCPACDNARRAMIEPQELARLRFLEAASVWLESHRRHIGPGTVRDYEQCIRTLSLFFSELTLAEIHIGHFEQYQAMRFEGSGTFTVMKAGASRTNHELNTLSQILTRAGLWAPIAPYYKPLPMPAPKVGRALSDPEQDYLFEVASSRPRWKVAYLGSLLSVNTTAGPGELLGIQLSDINLADDQVHIRWTPQEREGVKNRYRDRYIPLNETARWAIVQLIELAEKKGACLPEHYLFPHRAPNGQKGWDPTRPMYSWRTAWNKLRKKAGERYPSLATLRPYDLRHHVITQLLEDPNNSEETVVAIAGWVSENMKKVYSHVRMKPKREALAALEKKPPHLRSSSPAGAGFRMYALPLPDPDDPNDSNSRKPPGYDRTGHNGNRRPGYSRG
jgi:integrase